jgi:hypothetical protein
MDSEEEGQRVVDYTESELMEWNQTQDDIIH